MNKVIGATGPFKPVGKIVTATRRILTFSVWSSANKDAEVLVQAKSARAAKAIGLSKGLDANGVIRARRHRA